MAERHRVAHIRDVAPGAAREFVVAGRIIALYHVNGKFFAMDGVCPHAGGPLGEGTLNGNVVTCPWHGWQFDVTTGQHCLSSAIRHPTFPVSVEGEDVYVEL